MSGVDGILGTLIARWREREIALISDREVMRDDRVKARTLHENANELEAAVASLALPHPPQEAETMKLRSASESVGWLNSEGPLVVAPNFAVLPHPQEQDGGK